MQVATQKVKSGHTVPFINHHAHSLTTLIKNIKYLEDICEIFEEDAIAFIKLCSQNIALLLRNFHPLTLCIVQTEMD